MEYCSSPKSVYPDLTVMLSTTFPNPNISATSWTEFVKMKICAIHEKNMAIRKDMGNTKISLYMISGFSSQLGSLRSIVFPTYRLHFLVARSDQHWPRITVQKTPRWTRVLRIRATGLDKDCGRLPVENNKGQTRRDRIIFVPTYWLAVPYCMN